MWNQISIGWVRVLLLPAMILLTPFLIFLDRFSYDWSAPSTLISLAILIGVSLLCSLVMVAGGRILHSLIVAGLLTFFLDIQFEWIEGAGVLAKYVWLGTAIGVFTISWVLKENFFQIVTVIFTVFFVVTLGQLVLPKPAYDLHFEKPPPGRVGQSLPRMIHLVLDSHIGIEGIPQDSALGQQMKTDLKSFYQKNGFVVFGAAYSHYDLTRYSIANLMSFSSDPISLTESRIRGPEPYRLLQSRYFELLSSQGYKINVLANSIYIDYCTANAVVIENCDERPPARMKLLKGSDLVLVDKLRVVFSHFFNLGYTVKGIRYAYNYFMRALSDKGIDLPQWSWQPPSPLWPISSLDIFDTLSEKIETLEHGNIVYSHLIIPHHPYVLRSDCSLNPSLDQWKYNWYKKEKNELGEKNTFFSREERYRLYFDQMKCIYKKLDNLFEQMRKSGIYEGTIIILHGDHGSRIARIWPSGKNLEHLSKRDLEDYFSTLFAVKLPNVKEDYSVRRRPIENLLAETIFPNVKIGKKAKELEPFFFLRGGKEGTPLNFP